MQMLGQYHDGVDLKWVFMFHLGKSGTQQVDTFSQLSIVSVFGQVYREKPGGFGVLIVSVFGHGLLPGFSIDVVRSSPHLTCYGS